MPLGTIFATVVGYVVIAVLLLSLNLTSRWRWWIKGGTIAITGAFFVVSFFSITSMLGFPSGAGVPDRFTLISTLIVEPNNFTGAPGAIYLWLEELDENNVPSLTPRAYHLPYIDELADAVEEAQAMLDAGEEVEGAVEEAEEEAGGEDEDAEEAAPGEAGQGNNYVSIEFNLIFNDLPPVALPDKGAL